MLELFLTKSIVVFGGSGFIGSHLIKRLVTETNNLIICIDIKPPRQLYENVKYIYGDVRDLSKFQASAKIDRFYNLAAIHTTPGHPKHEYYETNVLGAIEVTRLASRLQVPEIIFTSSISVYGASEDTKNETSPLAPDTAYGYSKLMAERIHSQWFEVEPGRRLTIVRPGVVFGPGEGGNFTRLAKILKKGYFIYPGRKDAIKACFYVEDLIDAIEYGRIQGFPLTIFNGAYPQRFTLEEIVETLRSKHFPSARTLIVPRCFIMSAAKILNLLNDFGVGVHPDRIKKLLVSTNVFPSWLVEQKKVYPNALENAFQKWCDASGGQFV